MGTEQKKQILEVSFTIKSSVHFIKAIAVYEWTEGGKGTWLLYRKHGIKVIDHLKLDGWHHQPELVCLEYARNILEIRGFLEDPQAPENGY